jgi:hypothetical protein
MNNNSTTKVGSGRVPRPRGERARKLVGAGVALLALGLLIWAKLQLVVGVPRTAVATPENDPHAGRVVQKAPATNKPADGQGGASQSTGR